jgi:hypothetical protein
MKAQQRTNNSTLFSALIWGLTIGLVSWLSGWLAAELKWLDVLRRAVDFLALMLYPLLMPVILHKKTRLWINAFVFSAAGSMLASIAILSLRAIQAGSWNIVVLGLLGIVLVGQLLIPRFEQIPALQGEWSSPFWENLNGLPFIQFLFLQFNPINDIAG